MTFGKLQVQNTKNLLGPATRICALVSAPPKTGKTTFVAQLDKLTQRYRGKRSLIIASEVAEGGGTMSLSALDIDYVMPTSFTDMEQIVAQLATDETYGGVILDNATDWVSRLVKPHILRMPNPKAAYAQAQRLIGVPERSDYQVMGECARTQLNRLINLTNETTPEKYRKDLIVTALEKEKYDDSGTVTSITPDLPGALANAIAAMFQSVVTIRIKSGPGRRPDGSAFPLKRRYLHVKADGLRITDDRTGIFQDGYFITDEQGAPVEALLDMYTQWLEKHPGASA